MSFMHALDTHMNYGVIDMISPEECTIRRFIRDMQSLEPQTTPLEMDESLLISWRKEDYVELAVQPL